jgi:2-polyprenyl-3-methyl-5-hydroxy-6-metoxy-1,4-benzoquinol methylase
MAAGSQLRDAGGGSICNLQFEICNGRWRKRVKVPRTSSGLREEAAADPTAFYDRWYRERHGGIVVPDETDFAYGHLLRILGPLLSPGARVLDYGCGDGVVAFFAAMRGCTGLGVDVSPHAVARAQAHAAASGLAERVAFRVFDFAQGESLGPFDMAWAVEVIEHVPDDGAFLAWLARQLRPGGTCLLSTRLASEPLHRWRRRLAGRDWVDEGDGHLRRYDAEGLTRLVGSAGLAVCKIATAEGVVRNFCYKHRLGHILWGRLGRWAWGRRAVDRLDGWSLRWLGPANLILVAKQG